jgi:hypothetical protein
MLSGYGLQVTSAATSTDLDRGSARRRRTATKSKTVLDFSVALTDEQYAIFAAWWRYDLYDGTLPTTMKIKNGYADDPATIQFLKPYTATDQIGKWYISCQVEFEPFRLSESDLDAMIAGGTIYTLPPEVPGGPGIFPFYGYLRITQQPVSQSVLQPDSATFTIAAVGTGTLSYQWYKNGIPVGTDSTTYNTGATTWTGVDDVITCVVSNGVSSVNSDNATLTINRNPLLDLQLIASTGSNSLGITLDGQGLSVGFASLNMATMTPIVEIVGDLGGGSITWCVGRKSDGTCVSTGDNSEGQSNVSSWVGVARLGVWKRGTFGIKNDGTIYAIGYIAPASVLTAARAWTNIKHACGSLVTLYGLKNDGTVVAEGDLGSGRNACLTWTGIKHICAARSGILGLKNDGTCIFAGELHIAGTPVLNWTDVVSIACTANFHILGLKSDGTVYAYGSNGAGECNVSAWTGIKIIVAGYDYSLGVKGDGSVIGTGNNANSRITGTSTWRVF